MSSARVGILLWVFSVAVGLGQGEKRALTQRKAPEWFRHAVWYNIFPERFHNGDRSNDPTIDTLADTWPFDPQKSWGVMPWTAEWYALQPWEKENGKDFYYNAQLRRYGGDLQGILDKLDYLEDLGVNALYLNPVFESPSLHKYGAVLYHHIDNNFGPDPAGDAEIWAKENPADPTTWQWTAADKLFLKLIAECHRRGIRIIIDGVFNHVGIPFWALQKAKVEGPESPYGKWFRIKRWDDPATAEDEFDWEGWMGVRGLPEFAKDANGPHAEVKAHFRAVLTRWMDPNGDGDPSDGIDGWRLDVADKLPLAFWKEFRTWVQEINPDAFLTGEVWWDDYKEHKMMNAAPWLQGDVFDSVMNYRYGDALFRFFSATGEARISATELKASLEKLHHQYGYAKSLEVQNVLNSHDTQRTASMVVNPAHFIDHGANLKGNRDYFPRAPTAEERSLQRRIIAFQLLGPGAPFIYYGDEVGMWGADDPDCRKPMVWPEFNYAPETVGPFGKTRKPDPVLVDRELHAFYRKLIQLRKQHPALTAGDFKVIVADDARQEFAFQRRLQEASVVVSFGVERSRLGLEGQWERFYEEPGLDVWVSR